jgi:hypothetical protein
MNSSDAECSVNVGVDYVGSLALIAVESSTDKLATPGYTAESPERATAEKRQCLKEGMRRKQDREVPARQAINEMRKKRDAKVMGTDCVAGGTEPPVAREFSH